MEQVENNEKKYNKVQWFFFVIIIPFLFAITLSLVVLTVAGYNVFDLAKDYGSKIPVVSNYVKDSTEEPQTNRFELQAEIKNQQAQIDELQSEVDQKQQQIERLQAELDQLNEQQKSEQITKEQRLEKINGLAKTYAGMNPEEAAAVIQELENMEAAEIIDQMSNRNRAAIFEEMEPAKAATISQLIKEGVQSAD
ncbi:MotE family protein [Bacillus tianshenii]|nr:MotE family protein [Bacillus tianshenii]